MYYVGYSPSDLPVDEKVIARLLAAELTAVAAF